MMESVGARSGWGLEPFIHQVGGHSPLFCLDPVTVCKPFEAREQSFYCSLPDSLLRFTPAYKGSMQVHMTEDSDGYITLRGSPPSGYSRGQAASAARTQPKMRLKRCGSIEIENDCQPGKDQYFQDERVKEEVNPWALKCHRDNLKKVGIHPRRAPSSEPSCQQYILLENLTTGHKHPCVLDLKVGTRQHGDSASASKKLSKSTKVANSTSGTLGLRLGGMQVYQANLGRYICRTKNYGRGLTAEGLRSSLRQFFGNGLVLRTDVVRALLRKLAQLKSLLASLDSYRFYTSSLLITYDGSGSWQGGPSHPPPICRNSLSTSSLLLLGGALRGGLARARHTSAHSLSSLGTGGGHSGGRKRSLSCDQLLLPPPHQGSHPRGVEWDDLDTQCVDVRLIDFAHSTHRGLPASAPHSGPDRGFLFGLENLMALLEEILKPSLGKDQLDVLCLC